MQWEPGETAGFSDVPVKSLYAPVIGDEIYGPDRVSVKAQRGQPDSLLHIIRHMITVRKGHPAFGRGEFEWVDLDNPGIAAFRRSHAEESLLAIHNLSEKAQTIPLPINKSVTSMTDLLTQKEFAPASDTLDLRLEPYQYVWLSNTISR
jgi:maltose alpha-D-glucosyltransferase/alpha-amylase